MMKLTEFAGLSDSDRQQFVLRLAKLMPTRFVLQDNRHLYLPKFRDEVTGIVFLYVLAGEFTMGMTKREEMAARAICDPFPANIEEMRPVMSVTVEPYLMSETPVLRKMLPPEHPEYVRGYQPAYLSRLQAEQYCRWANCRLPSEKEWEYACRAGSTSLFAFGDELPSDDKLKSWMGWDFSDIETTKQNQFGFRGMYIGEWCLDGYKPTYDEGASTVPGVYVVRGGGAFFWPWQNQEWVWCMSAMRMPSSDLPDGLCGIRLVYGLSGDQAI